MQRECCAGKAVGRSCEDRKFLLEAILGCPWNGEGGLFCRSSREDDGNAAKSVR